MSHTAANGAPIADRNVSDPGHALTEQRARVCDRVGLTQLVLGGHRTDPKLLSVSLDAAQPSDAAQIDDVFGAREAHVEQGKQALTAREHTGLVCTLGEKRGHLVHR